MTDAEIEQAESDAAHRAIETYFAVLEARLNAGGRTMMKALGGTTHVHGSLCLGGDVTGVVEFTIRFETSASAVGYAVSMARLQGKL